ncbi:unnamed protein product, partial [Staurois parvus]
WSLALNLLGTPLGTPIASIYTCGSKLPEGAFRFLLRPGVGSGVFSARMWRGIMAFAKAYSPVQIPSNLVLIFWSPVIIHDTYVYLVTTIGTCSLCQDYIDYGH